VSVGFRIGFACVIVFGVASQSRGDILTPIDVPGSTETVAVGINSNGEIAGRYTSGGVQHGFLLSGGAFSTIDYSGATDTTAVGINAGRDIVGAHTNGGVQMAMS